MADMHPSRPTKIDNILPELAARFAERVTTNPGVRETHGKGETYHRSIPPEAVVFVTSTDEVRFVVNLCQQAKVPIIPYGAGTSLEGHLAAPAGGICIDCSQMNNIIEFNAADMDIVVEPGVTRRQLDAYLRDSGLFFPVDPGANATIGGMVATSASGTAAVRYGTMKENVLALEVILADGRTIKTGTRARKSAAGYDLTHLFVGSEGTLGVVTRVTLKLHGVPEAISAAVCSFPSVNDAVNAVTEIIQTGIPVARIELMDELQMKALNAYAGLSYPETPLLLFEFHGSAASVGEQAARAGEIAAEHGGAGFAWASNEDERRKLWRARHDAYYAALALKPGSSGMTTDICVPISALAECIRHTHQLLGESSLPGTVLGHVGDGNVHTLLLIDPENAAELAEAERINAQIVHKALSMDGTCTGEHGIGSGKISFLEDELGEATQVMRQIKAALDPDGIMNPGKVIA